MASLSQVKKSHETSIKLTRARKVQVRSSNNLDVKLTGQEKSQFRLVITLKFSKGGLFATSTTRKKFPDKIPRDYKVSKYVIRIKDPAQ